MLCLKLRCLIEISQKKLPHPVTQTLERIINFQDATHLDDAKVSIKLSEKSNIKVIPWIPAK